jgi:hypothetical protein
LRFMTLDLDFDAISVHFCVASPDTREVIKANKNQIASSNRIFK